MKSLFHIFRTKSTVSFHRAETGKSLFPKKILIALYLLEGEGFTVRQWMLLCLPVEKQLRSFHFPDNGSGEPGRPR